MPAPVTSSPTDGRINLEQQRKRAKERLKQLRQHPPFDQTLADAQWQIAKELGFSSWPKLVAHVEAIDFAARHPDFAASDEPRTTHWRCGNDIAHSLQLAGFKGRFRMLADPLCMGPVQQLPAAAYKRQRSRFVSQAFGLALGEVSRRFDDEYRDLAELGNGQPGVLWCEADAYDQLFLIRALAGLAQVPDGLELIEVSQVPGVERFIGIGQLAPDVLAWLWPQRRPVDAAMLQLARRAWQAYCDASPVPLAALARTDHPALPLLGGALRRQLQELPGVCDGLSLTERLALRVIAEAGSLPLGKVFGALMLRHEPLPYLGDLMFYAMMRPLIDGANPLLIEQEPQLPWAQRPVRLTALGERVLAGLAYWPDLASHERWVGGVCIAPGAAHWAIDEQGVPVWQVRQ